MADEVDAWLDDESIDLGEATPSRCGPLTPTETPPGSLASCDPPGIASPGECSGEECVCRDELLGRAVESGLIVQRHAKTTRSLACGQLGVDGWTRQTCIRGAHAPHALLLAVVERRRDLTDAFSEWDDEDEAEERAAVVAAAEKSQAIHQPAAVSVPSPSPKTATKPPPPLEVPAEEAAAAAADGEENVSVGQGEASTPMTEGESEADTPKAGESDAGTSNSMDNESEDSSPKKKKAGKKNGKKKAKKLSSHESSSQPASPAPPSPAPAPLPGLSSKITKVRARPLRIFAA